VPRLRLGEEKKKKERRKKKKEETKGRKYNGLPYYIGRPVIRDKHSDKIAVKTNMYS